jgi:hypothetical protein
MVEQKQCDSQNFHFFQESYESLNVTLCDTMTKLEHNFFPHKLNVPLCDIKIMLEQQFDHKSFHFPHKLH